MKTLHLISMLCMLLSFVTLTASNFTAEKILTGPSAAFCPVEEEAAATDTLPPPGFYCSEAPVLCEGFDTITGILGALNIAQLFPQCWGNVLNNTAWYGFVAGSSHIAIEILPENCAGLNGQQGMQGAIYAGCDGFPLALQCDCTTAPFVLESSQFIPGNTYYLVLDGCAGDICDYTLNVLQGSVVTPDTLPDTITGPDTILHASNYTAEYYVSWGDYFQWSMSPHNAGVFLNVAGGSSVEIEWFYSDTLSEVQLCAAVANSCSVVDTICRTILIGPLPVIPEYDAAIGVAGDFVALDSQLTTLCAGDTLFLAGFTLLDGDTVLNDGSFQYEWTIDDSITLEGKYATHVFSSGGFHEVSLHILYAAGHPGAGAGPAYIYVVESPSVAVTGVPAGPFCTGTEITMVAAAATDTLVLTDSLVFSAVFPDGLLIPDGSGTPLEVPLTVTGAPAGSTLSSADVLRICVNMEHSWMRDLEIKLTCPGGQSAVLHNHAGQVGGEVHVGIPDETDESMPEPGTGLDYCWTNDAANPTWIEYANAQIPTMLPPGDYTSFESPDSLLGCPVNGEWTFSFTDVWATDNGFVFSVSLLATLPDTQFIEITATPVWQPDPSLSFYAPDSIVATPDTTTVYLLDVTDNLGCGYQLAFPVEALPASDEACLPCTSLTADAGDDLIIDCSSTLPLTVNGSASIDGNFMAYTWTLNGAVLAMTTSLTVQQPGEYIFTAINTASGCTASDTMIIGTDQTPPVADAGADGSIDCNGIFQLDGSASSTGAGFAYQWSDPAGLSISSEITAVTSTPGVYTLTVTDLTNGCTAADEVFVTQDNIPYETMLEIKGDSCNLSTGAATATVTPPGLPVSFEWSTGQTGPGISGLAAGDYSVTVTMQLGCTQEQTFTVPVVVCTPLTENIPELSAFGLSPNPLRDHFSVRFTLGEGSELSFSLLDALGREAVALSPVQLYAAGEHSLAFRLPSLPAGTYFVRVKTATRQGAYRVVIAH